MDKVVKDFWKKWAEADILEKHEIIRNIVKKIFPKQGDYNKLNDIVYYNSFANILNSYFEDLYEYARQSNKKR